MGLNLCDVACVVQWKIADYLTLIYLTQQLGYCGKVPDMLALALVFIEQMHILPDNVDTITESDFKDS